MPNTSVFQQRMMVAAISACFPAVALSAGVARVDFAVGNVTAVAADGRSRPLARGAEIEVGETVATQQGRAQLRFVDGAYMSLQPQTEFKVEEFKYANSGKAEESDSIVMNLLKGGLRTITGLIGRANRNNYRLRTDVATIGIRGTEFSVKYTNSIEVFCADGSIFVQNDGGTLQLNSGQGGYVSNNDTPPQQTENRPVLPPESPVDQQIEEQQQTQDPVNPIQEANPPVTQTILTGKFSGNWAMVHLSRGVSASVDQVVELDGSGALIAASSDVFNPVQTTTIGTAVAQSEGNDGIIAWGRWVGGQTAGDGSFSNIDLAQSFEGPLHYVVGMPATNLPTSGTATYSMIGATTPTFTGIVSSASVASSSIDVNFASSSALFHLNMNVNGSSINTGSGVSLFRSGAHMTGCGSMTAGPFCGGASLNVNGFLAGDGASRAGMAYDIFVCCSGAIIGSIAYKKN